MIDKGLIDRYGTPAYVYELAEIRSAYEELRSSLPDKSALYYSLKANPHPEIARELCRLGCQAEVSSSGEMRTALSVGYQANECLYTGPGKTSEEIKAALKRNVKQFSVESPTDLRRVDDAAKALGTRTTVLVRVNADEPVKGPSLTMTGVASQFGTDAGSIIRRPELFMGTERATITGFHFFMGSQISEWQGLLTTFNAGIRLVRDLSEALHIDPEVVTLGGGLGTPSPSPAPVRTCRRFELH